jgi:uncharacterized protein YukE
MFDKYDMEAVALSRHVSSIDAAYGELTRLVTTFYQSAQPLVGTFSGQGKAAFNRFKTDTDQISEDLKVSLQSVHEGTQGQDAAFSSGDEEMTSVFDSKRSIVEARPAGTGA